MLTSCLKLHSFPSLQWVLDSCAQSKGEIEMHASHLHLFTVCLFTVSHSRSPIHQNIKEQIVKSSELDTVHIFRTLHNTARVYKNKVAQEVVAIERRPGGAKFEDVRELVAGARGRQVYEVGDVDRGIWTAGITVGLIDDIPTCGELLERMEREAEAVIDGLLKLRRPSCKL